MTISYNSKATGPVVTKFYVEPPEAVGTKHLDLMANMAAMPMSGKNLYKSSSEPIERWP